MHETGDGDYVGRTYPLGKRIIGGLVQTHISVGDVRGGCFTLQDSDGHDGLVVGGNRPARLTPWARRMK